MDRKEFSFRRVFVWSDRPSGGESVDGKLPSAAILPDGRRVLLDDASIMAVRWNMGVPNTGQWVVLARDESGTALLSERSRSGGDDFQRPHGRYATIVWILAPQGTLFEFGQEA